MKSSFLSFACAIAFSAYMTGCSDSSSSPDPVSPDSAASSEATGSNASQNPDGTPSSNPSGTDTSPATPAQFNTDPAKAGLSITADADGFYDIGDIYKAAPAESKIVFLLRHGERESGLGQESPLTQVGVQQGLDAGKKLAGGDASFYYASTDFVRTKVTNKYLIDHGLNECFYDLFERGEQFVREVILANLPNWKRVNVLISHDLLLEPLVVYVSARSIDLKAYESYRWINYVAGIAVIQDAAGQVTLLPARGTDSGVLNTRDAYGSK